MEAENAVSPSVAGVLHEEEPVAASSNDGATSPEKATFSAEEIQTAVRVLQAMGASEELFMSQEMKPIRKVLEPVSAIHERRKFGGGSKDAWTESKVQSKTVTLLHNRQKQLERSFVNKTQLRAARLQKLAALTEQGAGTALLVPDGAASDLPLSSGAEALLLKDKDSSAALRMLEDKKDDDGSEAAGDTATTPLPIEGMAADGSVELAALTHACYCCKARYKTLHHFYSHLCPRCASINWAKRNQTCDLSGHIALVTGSRVKIGYMTTLKLLRAGCRVIATTRFPHDAAERYASMPDFDDWKDRLEIYGLDLRDLPTLEAFCAMLKAKLPYLTVIINNACQTVRRPPAFYRPLLTKELKAVADLPASHRPLVKEAHAHIQGDRWAGRLLESAKGTAKVLLEDAPPSAAAAAEPSPSSSSSSSMMTVATDGTGSGSGGAGGRMNSAALSQVAVVPGDEVVHEDEFPENLVDVNGQSVDLRTKNSWTMKMDEISTPELAEVFCINAMAPFIIAARLKDLMAKGRGDIPPYARKDNWKRDDPATVEALRRYLTPALREALLGEPVPAEDSAAADTSSSSSSGAPPAKRSRTEAGASDSKNPHSQQFQQQKRLLKGVGTMLGEVAGADIPLDLCRFIVNVSAMEGKFSRSKLPTHPHTNAAKAALNMQVRTSAGDYASSLIFMTCVDTGWINEENPAHIAARTAARHGFQTPIDEIDAAARILAPVFDAVIEAQDKEKGDGTCRPVYGGFLKDYFLSEW